MGSAAFIEIMDGQLPRPRALGVAAYDGNSVYVFTGRDSVSWDLPIDKFNPATGTSTTTGTSLPIIRTGEPFVAWIAPYFYILGGGGTSDLRILRYDPVAGTVSPTGVSLPHMRDAFAGFSDGTSIYAAGGNQGGGGTCAPFYLTSIIKYTPSTNQLVTLTTTLPSARAGMASAWDGNYGYIIGGLVKNCGSVTQSRQILRFDPTVDSYQVVGSLPSGITVVDGEAIWNGTHILYFPGGTDVWAFNPINGTTYRVDSLPEARINRPARFSSGDGTVYLMGGGTSSSNQYTSTIVRYSNTPGRPGSPQGLSVTVGPGLGNLTVAWSPPTPNGSPAVTNYRIYRGTTTTNLDAVETVDASTLSVEHHGLQNGTTYYYRIAAINSVGEGVGSSIVAGSTFSGGLGRMSLGESPGDRPACYGVAFTGAPGSRCSADLFGFSDDTTVDGANVSFTIDLGDFNRHSDVRCGPGTCLFRFEFDLNVLGAAQNYSAFDGQVVPAAQLQRYDAPSSSWLNVTGGLVDGLLLSPDGLNDWGLHLVPRLLLSPEELDPSNATLWRLRAADRPGSPGSPWSLELFAAKIQLVASPVVFLHGWSPRPDRPEYFETAGWVDAYIDGLGVAASSELGQNPWSWANQQSFVNLSFDAKKDFRLSAFDLYRAILHVREDPTQGLDPDLRYLGPVSLVGHSGGGIMARYLIEDLLPRLQALNEGRPTNVPDEISKELFEANRGPVYAPTELVADLTMLGSSNDGIALAETYIQTLDRMTERGSTAWSPVPGVQGNHYYADRDGNKLNSWFGPWFSKGPWWLESVGAYRNWDVFTNDNPHVSVMIDYEALPVAGANPVLADLNTKFASSGIPYFLVAGNREWKDLFSPLNVVDGNLWDGFVHFNSATHHQDDRACWQLYWDHDGPSNFPVVENARHTNLPFQEEIQADSFKFMSGNKYDICQNTPTYLAPPASSAASFTSLSAGPPPVVSGLSPALEISATNAGSINSLVVEWHAPGQGNATLTLHAVNDTFSGINVTLHHPTLENAEFSAGNTSWVNWSLDQGSVDEVLVVHMKNASVGNWRLWVNATRNWNGTFVPFLTQGSAIEARIIGGSSMIQNEASLYQVRLTNQTMPVLGANATLQHFDPTSTNVVTTHLRDDGTSGDLAANDGVYSSTITIGARGEYPALVTATINGRNFSYSAALGVLGSPEEARLTCGQILLATGLDIVQAILELNPSFAADCLADGEPEQLADALIAAASRAASDEVNPVLNLAESRLRSETAAVRDGFVTSLAGRGTPLASIRPNATILVFPDQDGHYTLDIVGFVAPSSDARYTPVTGNVTLSLRFLHLPYMQGELSTTMYHDVQKPLFLDGGRGQVRIAKREIHAVFGEGDGSVYFLEAGFAVAFAVVSHDDGTRWMRSAPFAPNQFFVRPDSSQAELILADALDGQKHLIEGCTTCLSISVHDRLALPVAFLPEPRNVVTLGGV